MMLWASLAAVAMAVLGFLATDIDPATVVRSFLELGAVIGVFALVCAAEAAN